MALYYKTVFPTLATDTLKDIIFSFNFISKHKDMLKVHIGSMAKVLQYAIEEKEQRKEEK